MLAKGFNGGDLNSLTITDANEQDLIEPIENDNPSPEFMTEVFRQFQELLQEALLDKNYLHQMTTYLD